MLFNSLGFLIFLPAVFFTYWFAAKKSITVQNVLLLIASYFFYGCWDWRFLFLLAFSTILDFYSGHAIFNANNIKTRKIWLTISVAINLGFLGVFKYYNFFIGSFAEILHQVGLNANMPSLNVILPVGISFYTFHGLSYVFDIYNKKISPSSNIIEYSLFVSFFPLLVAGPIERATHLLPQIEKPRVFKSSKMYDGLKQILWGLFKKLVIADSCAEYANLIFNNANDYSGSALILGAILFTFQIYGDFSGYSDIALGVARLFGFELLKNFNFPYFSRSIAEFWRRWHISLSSWFKDYLYFPLGGGRGSTIMRVRNTFIIFLVSGFWHGANWTFILWGALNALFIMPSIIFKTNRDTLDVVAQGKITPSFKELCLMISTFTLTVLAWIFFRAESLTKAISFVKGIFTMKLFSIPFLVYPTLRPTLLLIFIILFFVLIEWLGRENNYAIEKIGSKFSHKIRWGFYIFLIFLIGMYMHTEKTEFIYFQF